MLPGTSGSKRRVSTCIPCYSRKQKCNRRYPCQHCTKRRRPEECVYHNQTAPSTSSALQLGPQRSESGTAPTFRRSSVQATQRPQTGEDLALHDTRDRTRDTDPNRRNLLQSFGYSEYSSSNTIALLKSLDPEIVEDGISNQAMALPSIFESARWDLDRMPDRQTLDCLMQYFVSDLNWMKQLVHAPSFLMEYQQWWMKDSHLSPDAIEFAVLILRIAVYTSHFWPSSILTSDTINNATLPHIRTRCTEIANRLAKTCVSLSWRGSLVRVQHILFAAISSSCEGRTDQFWEGVSEASHAAQKAGLHENHCDQGYHETEVMKEMRRRVYCALYHLDSHLSRQLDRVPFLPENLDDEMIPRMHLAANGDCNTDAGAPDLYAERLSQVRLAQFWRKQGNTRGHEYNATEAEHRYERFCTQFLPTLPPTLALTPDTKWDRHLPKLPMQRQLLHIAVFDYVCWNFRPTLLLKPCQISGLPQYKQVLLHWQKKVLATAALKQLEATTTLHCMFNGGSPHFGAIIFNSFEASVILLALYSQPDFLGHEEDDAGHSYGLKPTRLTRRRMMSAVEKALDRLQKLAETNDMATAGVRSLKQIISNVSVKDDESSNSVTSNSSSSWSLPFSMDLLGNDFNAGCSDPVLTYMDQALANASSMASQDDPYLALQMSSAPEMMPGFDFPA